MHALFELRAQTFSHSVHELAILPELAHVTSHLTTRARNTQKYRLNNKFWNINIRFTRESNSYLSNRASLLSTRARKASDI